MVAVKTNLERNLCKNSAESQDPKTGSGVLDSHIYKGPDETKSVVETRLFPPSLGGPVVLLTLIAGATQVSPPNLNRHRPCLSLMCGLTSLLFLRQCADPSARMCVLTCHSLRVLMQ